MGELLRCLRLFEIAGNIAKLESLGRHKEHRIDIRDRLLEGPRHGRVVGVVVRAVERQVANRNLGELHLLRLKLDQRVRELAIDRRLRDAADEVSNFIRGHD
jgi:hypothetical protein